MIKLIGVTKLFLILLLGGGILGGLFYTHKMLTPNLTKVERSLAQSKGEISEMSHNMDELSKGLSQFEVQKEAFANVQKLGFFNEQDRVEARGLIAAMQKESRLLAAKYSISPASRMTEKRASDAGYDLLNTSIDFTLEAIEDTDIYKFVYLLNYGFPGQVTIQSLSIERDQEITQPLLRQIGVGQAKPIVTAQLKASWKTMLPTGTMPSNNNEGGY